MLSAMLLAAFIYEYCVFNIPIHLNFNVKITEPWPGG